LLLDASVTGALLEVDDPSGALRRGDVIELGLDSAHTAAAVRSVRTGTANGRALLGVEFIEPDDEARAALDALVAKDRADVRWRWDTAR
jgi:hypothetical protein